MKKIPAQEVAGFLGVFNIINPQNYQTAAAASSEAFYVYLFSISSFV